MYSERARGYASLGFQAPATTRYRHPASARTIPS